MTRLPSFRVVVAFRAARSRLARFVTGSIAVHGVLLAVILIVPATRHRAPPIDDTMVVALAGPIASAPAPSGGAAAPPSVKPAPAPPPAPKEAHTVREVPAEKPKEKPVKPKKDPVKTPEPTALPAPTPSPGAVPAPTPGTPGGGPPDAKAGNGGAALTATVGGGDSTLGWYGAAVKAALEAVWMKPYLEDAQGTASVVITFDIARDGTTKNLRIQQSSGIPSLDRSAQRAVIEASPLPPVPPAWTQATIPVTMRFELAPETR